MSAEQSCQADLGPRKQSFLSVIPVLRNNWIFLWILQMNIFDNLVRLTGSSGMATVRLRTAFPGIRTASNILTRVRWRGWHARTDSKVHSKTENAPQTDAQTAGLAGRSVARGRQHFEITSFQAGCVKKIVCIFYLQSSLLGVEVSRWEWVGAGSGCWKWVLGGPAVPAAVVTVLSGEGQATSWADRPANVAPSTPHPSPPHYC